MQPAHGMKPPPRRALRHQWRYSYPRRSQNADTTTATVATSTLRRYAEAVMERAARRLKRAAHIFQLQGRQFGLLHRQQAHTQRLNRGETTLRPR